MAAIRRTSTLIGCEPPTRWKVWYSTTRCSRAWALRLRLATSSRKSVPPWARSKMPDPPLGGPGEGPPLVAEQVGHQQLVLEGAAVDDEVGLVAPRAGGVDEAGEQLLPGAALTPDQDRAGDPRQVAGLLDDIDGRRGSARSRRRSRSSFSCVFIMSRWRTDSSPRRVEGVRIGRQASSGPVDPGVRGRGLGYHARHGRKRCALSGHPVLRPPARPRRPLLHRDVGAVRLLRHARPAHPLPDGRGRRRGPGLRRRGRRLDLRPLHVAGVPLRPARGLDRRPHHRAATRGADRRDPDRRPATCPWPCPAPSPSSAAWAWWSSAPVSSRPTSA